jgi:hypothetical protein
LEHVKRIEEREIAEEKRAAARLIQEEKKKYELIFKSLKSISILLYIIKFFIKII